MNQAIKPWCAKAQYPGLREFLVGTITMPHPSRHDEIIEALEAHALTFLPPGFIIIEPLCGALFFQEE